MKKVSTPGFEPATFGFLGKSLTITAIETCSAGVLLHYYNASSSNFR